MSNTTTFDPIEAEAQIREYSQTWASVAVTGDPSVLERIFANDFIGIDSDGKQYTKREFIEGIRVNPANFLSNNVNEVNVRFFGTVAIAQGNETFMNKSGLSKRFVWTDIYVFRESRWEMVAAQDVVASEDTDPNSSPFIYRSSDLI